MTNQQYIHPLTLAYYVCNKTGWTIGTQRLNYMMYLIAMCYAGETHSMIVPNLFEVEYPALYPINKVVTEALKYREVIKNYHISREYKNSIDVERREFIDRIVNECMKKTDGELFRISITERNRDKSFIANGQLSLQDMINQYNGIVALADEKEAA